MDVTSYITGNGVYNLAFSTTSNTNINFSSREGANAPQLVIEMSTGATNTPTATATTGPSPTPTRTPTVVGTNTPTVPPTATPTTQPVFQNATFVYDGDDKRVKSIINSAITTYFVSAHYEVSEGSGSTITKYYYAGGQRIAMRSNGTLNYLLGDHLGSTSLTTDAVGNTVSEIRYKACGKVRYATEGVPTRYQYTGQFSDSYINLLWYGSRHYDPVLGRFAQADTIVPSGIQGLDRYVYVNNNPLRYIDPTGHKFVCSDANADAGCSNPKASKGTNSSAPNTLAPKEIMKLLGFQSQSELDAWIGLSENNANFAEMLAYAQVGDVIKINWSGGGDKHLRLVQYGEGVSFYSLDARSLVRGNDIQDLTSYSGANLLGAGILRDSDNDGTFSPWSESEQFGDITMSPYELPKGWNRASDGKGGLVMHAQLGLPDILGLGASAVPLLAIPVIGEPAGFAGGVLGVLTVLYYADKVPTYYDHLPPQ